MGNDLINGGGGANVIDGGLGADILGGPGANTYVYKQLADSTVSLNGRDQIVDFNPAKGDIIDLSVLDTRLKVNGSVAFHLAGSSFTHQAGELIQIHTKGGILLEGDSHGTGIADFAILFVNLVTPLVTSDFIF